MTPPPTRAPAILWLDLSGHANDFDLGRGPGADDRDPAFDAGSFVMGSAWFTKHGANGAFVNAIHRPGARFTIELWVYVVPSPDAYFIALGTTDNLGTTGFRWFLEGALGGFGVDAPAPELQTPSKRLVAMDRWQQLAISVDTVAGTGFTLRDGSRFPHDDPDFTVDAWGTLDADAPHLLRLGAQTNDGAALWPAGSRYAIVRMYDRALTEDELRQNFLAQRERFGL
ncbi:MAG: hypothetical protein QM767_29935 [Anaeromyxobacter sp.]